MSEAKETQPKILQIELTDKVTLSVKGAEITYEDVYVMIDGMISSIVKEDMNDRIAIAESFVNMYKAQAAAASAPEASPEASK